MKLRQLIKSSEFVAMVGIPILAAFLKGMDWFWAILIPCVYIAINVFGYANKALWEVRDEVKSKLKK